MFPNRPIVTAKPFARIGATVASPFDSDDELSDSTAMAQPVAIPAPAAPTPLKLRRAQAHSVVSPASLSLPSLPKPEPEGPLLTSSSGGSVTSAKRQGACSLTLLQLPKGVFESERGRAPTRSSGLCAGFPGRSPVLGPAVAKDRPKSSNANGDPVHVHAAPDSVLLPFLNRPAEVKELLDQPINARIAQRIRIAFRDDVEWADISALLFKSDRDELPDEQWIRILKRKLCPKAPDTWATLSSCLGADHLDLRGEDDEAVCNEERCVPYAWPTSGRRQSVRHDSWARADEDHGFEDLFASSPASSLRSSQVAAADLSRGGSPSLWTPALEVEVLHELPASFRKPSGALKDSDISAMAHEEGSSHHIGSHHMASSSSSSGADLPDIAEEEAQPPAADLTNPQQAKSETAKRDDSSPSRHRRLSTSLTSETFDTVKHTMEMHKGAFAALRIRTSSFSSASLSTPPTPRSLSHSDTLSALSSMSTAPSPLLPSPALGSSQCEIVESEQRSKLALSGPLSSASPTPPFLQCRRLSQLIKPFVDDAPGKPHADESTQTPGGGSRHGRRAKHVSINPTPVGTDRTADALFRRHSSGYQHRLPCGTTGVSSSSVVDFVTPPRSPGCPGVPPQARRRRSFARSFGELTPIVPTVRRHTVTAHQEPPSAEVLVGGTESSAADEAVSSGSRQPRRHTVGAASQRPLLEEVAELEARGSPKPHDLGLLPDGRTRHPSAGAKGAGAALAAFRASLGLSPRDPERKSSFGSSSGGGGIGSQSSSRKPSIEHAETSRPTLNRLQTTSAKESPKLQPCDNIGDIQPEPLPAAAASPLAKSASSQGSLPRTPRVHRREGGFASFSREYQRYNKARARASSAVSEAFSSGSQAVLVSDSDEDGSHVQDLERSTPDLVSPPTPGDSVGSSLGLVGVPEQRQGRLSDMTPKHKNPRTAATARRPSSADTHRSDDTAATSPGTLFCNPFSRSRSASEASAQHHAQGGSKEVHRRTVLVFPIPPSASRSERFKAMLEDQGAQEALRAVEAAIGAEGVSKLREMLCAHERHEVDDAKLLEAVADECFRLADLESNDAVARERAEERAVEDDYPRRWLAFERFCNDVCRLDAHVVAQARKRSGPAMSLCARSH